MVASLLALLLLFPVTVVVPGLAVVRRLQLPEVHRLPLAVALSVGALYLAGFALYLADAPDAVALALEGALLAGAVLLRRDLLALARAPSVRDLLVPWAMFAGWVVLLSLLVRNFSGALWAGDWLEHFGRAGVFLGELPADYRFLGRWPLTARPPLQNLAASFLLRTFGRSFEAFQLGAVLLASLQLLGAASLWSALTRRDGGARRAGLLVLVLLLCLNPAVVENATYPWTRALTGFFLLEGAALYVAGLRDGVPALRRWALLLAGLALATHYSAAPYLVALAPVEGWLLVRRRLRPREAALGVVLTAAPAAPWFAYALARFGLGGAFLTSSTVAWGEGRGAAELALVAVRNVAVNLVPHPLRDVPPHLAQAWAPAYWRDWFFLIYQVTIPGLLGSAGAIAVAVLLAHGALRRVRVGDREPAALLGAFVALVVVLGIATVPGVEEYGSAHVCLQPLAVAGLAFLAARREALPGWARAALWCGAAIDLVLGIGLQFWMEHLTLADLRRVTPDLSGVSPSFADAVRAPPTLPFTLLGDHPGAGALAAVLAVALSLLVAREVRALRPPAAAPAASA